MKKQSAIYIVDISKNLQVRVSGVWLEEDQLNFVNKKVSIENIPYLGDDARIPTSFRSAPNSRVAQFRSLEAAKRCAAKWHAVCLEKATQEFNSKLDKVRTLKEKKLVK